MTPERAAHHHRCATCGTKVPCGGEIQPHVDGEPAWICHAYPDAREVRCAACAQTDRAQAVRDALEDL